MFQTVPTRHGLCHTNNKLLPVEATKAEVKKKKKKKKH